MSRWFRSFHKSVYLKADSIQGVKDSLSKILPEETHPDRWGISFYFQLAKRPLNLTAWNVSHPLMFGNTSLSHPLDNTHLFSSWNFDYLSQVDSLFEQRYLEFDLDSTVFILGNTKAAT